MIDKIQAGAAVELARRRCEALRIFRALPYQEEFFHSMAREILARGGNRSGKSTLSAILFAAVATDRQILDSQGNPMDARRPWQKNRPLTMWCIGYGQSHVGQTLYRLLFRPGLFRIIWDPQLKNWRAFNPNDPNDQKRAHQVKPSPPLIPNRYIKKGSWSWENKGEKVFTKVEIVDPVTGEDLAEIYAFTSSGEVKAGDPVDFIWVDEAIKYPKHYPEWQARLIDRRGRIVWSSWPRMSNNALIELTDRALQCREREEKDPAVEEFVFTMSQNPYLTVQSKKEALQGWSEEERRSRDRGEYNTDVLLMYHTFNKNVHTAMVPEDGEDKLSKTLRQNNGTPPDDWTRYLVLDPGTSNPAVLFCAIPPPTFGNYYVPYREIYIPRLDADQLAKKIAEITHGEYFENFIIDPRAGRQTPMGFKTTVAENYSRAFRERGLSSARSRSSFTNGSDNVPGRIGLLQSWMTIQPNGYPRLRIVTQNCPNLVKQLQEYRKSVDLNGHAEEFKPMPRQKIDMAVALEYFCSCRPEWEPRPLTPSKMSDAHKRYLALRKKYDRKSKKR